ncbi:uncharacterized protein LOC108053529 isoform X1 [Drosophila rhopaloa]|uniref:Uncharacterized protein n=2 Tax=Drosophila rhopaloa TaxID=1041015 RepID=A0ABM5I814_DRORH|nr:uncharacterized protein LOC108053529 isoform X1 [Drosophila rhopaloa]
MDRTTIFSLNYYCLFLIFENIKTNCETERNLKRENIIDMYRDLINFVISCVEFQIAFRNWNKKLFDDLIGYYVELKIAFRNANKKLFDDLIDYFQLRVADDVSVHFSAIYNSLQNVSKKDKDHFWNYFTTAIKENVNMQSLELYYKSTEYHPEHLDRLQAIMHSLKNKTLHKLDVDFGSDYSFENFGTFGHLRSLKVNARMCAYDLVQLCRSNPNLCDITFYSTELYGRFSDIVPYCSQLKCLELLMKPDVDATEYATLANLPQLEELWLGGIHQEGTLTELFNGLKLKGVKKLCIPKSMLSKQETQALAQIRSIIAIWSAFSDDNIIWNLAHIPNLESITVFTRPEQYNIMVQFKNVLKKVVVILITPFMTLYLISPGPKPGNLFLNLEIRRFFYGEEHNDEISSDILNFITPLSQRIEVNELHTMGFSGFLQALLQSLANQKLRNVYIREKISMEEADSLVSIPSLNNIICYHNLEEIILMKCKQLDGIKNTETRVYRFRNPEWWARIIHGNFLTLIVDFSECSFRFFCPLANFKNLKKLVIKGYYMCDSLTLLFKRFEENRNLEDLEMDIIDTTALHGLAQISSIKVLKCGFFCSRAYRTLANLNQLESLTISLQPNGSLKRLFNLLADEEQYRNLQADISIDEATANNLKTLQTISRYWYRPSHQCEDILQNLTDLRLHGISMWGLLKELKVLSSLQSLFLDNSHLDFLDIVELTKISWLKHLRLGLTDKKCILMLIQLKNLEVLEITSTHHAAEDESNFILPFLESCQNLRSITLHRYYDFLSKDYLNGILTVIKLLKDPETNPPFELVGMWCDFENLNQLHGYDDAFLLLRRIKQEEFESDEDDIVLNDDFWEKFEMDLINYNDNSSYSDEENN